MAGFKIDAKEMGNAIAFVDGDNGSRSIAYAMVHGYEMSYQENRTFEDSMFWVSGLSAVKAIQVLKAQGVPIQEIPGKGQFYSPYLPQMVIDDINNSLNQGWNVIVPVETRGLPTIPYITYDPKTGSAGYMIATAAGGFNAYLEVSQELAVRIVRSLTWTGPKLLLGVDFVALDPANGATFKLGDSFFVQFKLILKWWQDGKGTWTEEMVTDSYGNPWGLQVRTGPGLFSYTMVPLPWWNPGHYTIKYNGKVVYEFDLWGVTVDPAAQTKYLGITTINGADTVQKSLQVAYSITDAPNVNLSAASLKVYSSANSANPVRNMALPANTGAQTATWDGKDDAGQIVAPGDYSMVIEADGQGGTAKSEKYTVIVFKAVLKEVSFSGTNYHVIRKDDGSKFYDAPHWQDNSSPANGNANDSSDRNYPVSFTRNTKATVAAVITVDPPSAFISGRIRGDGPGSLDVPATTATVSGNEMTITAVESAGTFENKVAFLDPMTMQWEVSPDGGKSWFASGLSSHQVYVTLGDPLTTVYHTAVHIGCKNAAGETTEAQTASKIWSEFTDRNVQRTDGTQLKYWDGGAANATNTSMLLHDGNGQCGSWAEFLIDSLKVQGISSAKKILIVEATDPMNRLFLVKTWQYNGTGMSPGTAPYSYVMDVDVVDQPGVPGQGNPDPPGAFYNHFIVQYGSQFYDPSYGNGPFTSQAAWENASLDGFSARGTVGGTPAEFVKKNNPAILETLFQ